MLNKDPVVILYYYSYCFIPMPCPSGAFCGTSAVMRWAGEQLPPELTPAGLEDWQTLHPPSTHYVRD